MARTAGGRLRHLKLHGALSNMAAEDDTLAQTCFDAALTLFPDLVILVQPLTAMEAAARALGCEWAGEIYSDRAYTDQATLVPRSQPGAIIEAPQDAAEAAVAMVGAQAIVCASGQRLPARIDSICVHGDTPHCLEIATAVRAALEAEGHRLSPL